MQRVRRSRRVASARRSVHVAPCRVACGHDDHIAALTNELPRVERILTIGWRAQEQHFLTLLSARVTKPVSIWCVSGDAAKSEETLSRLRQARLLIDGAHAADMGFSELVSTRAAQDFMKI